MQLPQSYKWIPPVLLSNVILQQDEEYGITALGLACSEGNKAIAELLILKGANVNSKDKVSEWGRLNSSLNLYNHSFFDYGYQFPLQNGFTPLHRACRENHTDVVNLLLTYGAKIDVSAKVMNKYHKVKVVDIKSTGKVEKALVNYML